MELLSKEKAKLKRFVKSAAFPCYKNGDSGWKRALRLWPQDHLRFARAAIPAFARSCSLRQCKSDPGCNSETLRAASAALAPSAGPALGQNAFSKSCQSSEAWCCRVLPHFEGSSRSTAGPELPGCLRCSGCPARGCGRQT